MKRLIALSLSILGFVALVNAQVTVQFKPEPQSVLSALHLKTLAPWNVMGCNDGAPVLLAPERIKMAAPAVPWIETGRVQAALATAQSRTLPAAAAAGVEIGLDMVGMLGGFGTIAMSKKVLGYIAMGTGFAHYAEGKLQGATPSLAPYTQNLLTGPVSLGTGECGTWTLFAGKMAKPQTISASITARN